MAIYSPNLRPEADTGRKSRYSGRNYRLTDIYIYIVSVGYRLKIPIPIPRISTDIYRYRYFGTSLLCNSAISPTNIP